MTGCQPMIKIRHQPVYKVRPPLVGAAATMDPWSETEVDTRDITALGYSYA